MRIGHLSRRFVGSLSPVGPSTEATAWVRSVLSPEEFALWMRMPAADRRHSVVVALRAEAILAGRHTASAPGRTPAAAEPAARVARPVLAAALLHDVGKLASGLGTYNRVVATLCGAATKGEMALLWSQTSGYTRRIGLYLRHAPLGADMLAMAGSDPLTVTWAREHHLAPEQWTLDPRVAAALNAADDD